jgi:hypothetical protein
MARLLAPEKMTEKVADRMSEIHPNETLKDALDAVGDALDRARRSMEDVAEHAPEPSSVGMRLPKPADILASVPGAVEIARRVPSLREVRASAADVRESARDVALEAARQTPLRDHPVLRRGPGPLAVAGRIGLLALVAGLVGFVIVNRDRVRRAVAGARSRMDEMAGRGDDMLPSAGEAWGDGGASVEVDEVLLVETVGGTEPGVAPGGTLPADQAGSDLDATGWGTEGTPTAPRQMSADVAAMTTPSDATNPEQHGPSTNRPGERGE